MILSQVLCCGQNKATRACSTDVCTFQTDAFLCDNPNCQCHINHKQCTIKSFPISQLVLALHHKGKTYLPVLEELLKFYDNTIKMISTSKQEVLMIMSECSLTLIQQEKDIYLRLKNKQMLSTKDMRMIISKLMNESKINIDERLKEITQMTKKYELEINKILHSLKQFEQFKIKQKEIQKPKIVESTKPIQNSSIKIQNKRAVSGILVTQLLKCQKTVQIKPDSQFLTIPNQHFALILKPTLNDKISKYRSFSFKIINIPPQQQQHQRSLFIGIIKNNSPHQFYNHTNLSVVNISSTGRGVDNYKKIYGSSVSMESNFSFEKNDVIRVDFDPFNKKLLIFNGFVSTIIHDVDPAENYYLCVGFQQLGQEVEYMGEYDPITNKQLE